MMHKSGSRVDDLIAHFETAAMQGSDKLHAAVATAMAQALDDGGQSLANIGEVLGALMHAVNAAGHKDSALDTKRLAEEALAGTDKIILQALGAQQAALAQKADQRGDLRQRSASALAVNLGEFEDAVMGMMQQAAASAGPSAGVDSHAKKVEGGLPGLLGNPTVQATLKNSQAAMHHTRVAAMSAGAVMSDSESAAASDLLSGMAAALRCASDKSALKMRTGS